MCSHLELFMTCCIFLKTVISHLWHFKMPYFCDWSDIASSTLFCNIGASRTIRTAILFESMDQKRNLSKTKHLTEKRRAFQTHSIWRPILCHKSFSIIAFLFLKTHEHQISEPSLVTRCEIFVWFSPFIFCHRTISRERSKLWDLLFPFLVKNEELTRKFVENIIFRKKSLRSQFLESRKLIQGFLQKTTVYHNSEVIRY